MFQKNQANRLRTEILARMAQAFWSGELEAKADRIPIEMRPKDQAHLRCCLYKDRATIRYRIMAALGVDIQGETDELKPLAEYVRDTAVNGTVAVGSPVAGDSKVHPILSILESACQGCVPARYLVTNACQGCVARPCSSNCGRSAVAFDGGRARIGADKCVNCGKCEDVCPYHAITRIPVPCEESCPVGAIHKNASGKAEIDVPKCISCGRCMSACPFDAIMERLQFIQVLREIAEGRPVVALVAPAVLGQYPGSLEQILGGLRALGFAEAVEVARGADETAEHEAHEFVERMERGDSVLATSCCPAWVRAVDRHLPDLKKYVSETPSPMIFAARAVKARRPEALAVFIGPCVAKRMEAATAREVDFVLNFEELGALFVAKGIEIAKLPRETEASVPSKEARAFAIVGGAANAVTRKIGGRVTVRPEVVDGLNKRSIRKLQGMGGGEPGSANFIEVMCCEGGCVAGPCVIASPKAAGVKITKLTGVSPASSPARG